MKGLKEQVWVTSAVIDDDVEKALILCYSLKRVYTSRKIVVMASQQLSTNMRNSLSHAFDFVFYLEEDQNEAHLKLEDYAKLYSIRALKSFDNCAYVSSYMLALKNCDEIFSVETEGLVMIEEDEKASIFLFNPSMENYTALTTGLRTFEMNGFGFGTYLKKWIKNNFKGTESLDRKYNVLTQERSLFGYRKLIITPRSAIQR